MKAMMMAALIAAGCTQSYGTQAVGAVCMRAKKISEAVHAERVEIATALKEGGKSEIELAARCRATRSLDGAVQEVYSIVLDAQLITTERWKPLSEKIHPIANAEADVCEAIAAKTTDAFSKFRKWAEEMQLAHEQAYQACRALTKK